MQNGKGSSRRIEDQKAFENGYERIFIFGGHCCLPMKNSISSGSVKFNNNIYKYNNKTLNKCPFCHIIINNQKYSKRVS